MDSNNFIEHQGPLQSLQKHNIDHILRQINPTYTLIFIYHLILYAIRLRLPRDLLLSFFSHNLITISKFLSRATCLTHRNNIKCNWRLWFSGQNLRPQTLVWRPCPSREASYCCSNSFGEDYLKLGHDRFHQYLFLNSSVTNNPVMLGF